MKNILIVLLFLPSFCLSQSERDEKLRFKSGQSQHVTQSTESQQKITHKTHNNLSSQREIFQTGPNILMPNRYYDDLEWRWRNWGAPISGVVGYTPSFYYDRFGFRQPSRIYRMSDGEQKVVKGDKTHWRLGLSINTKKQLGGWLSVGNQRFFIGEYTSYVSNDQSSFLPSLTMADVIPWNDQRLDEIKLGGELYLGAGIKLSSFGLYIMPGYGWERNNFQFFDELFILSNNGKYSFPNYDDRYFTGKLGIIYDYKMITTKMDYNPFRNNINFGAGIIF